MSYKKYRAITAGFANRNETDVQREIDNFLLALNSYPSRFASDPELTFEQYLYSIMASENESKRGPYSVN